jgi:hypothetical protein
VSKTLENGRDDVPCSVESAPLNEDIRWPEVPSDSPLLSFILYFIAQVKDDLPVLTGQSLICRFHFSEEEELSVELRERTVESEYVPTTSSKGFAGVPLNMGR